MSWLSEPLADAGFYALAVDHHGNNFVDGYLPEGFAFVWERVRDLRFALDWFAGREPLGPVGAAGFSLGGYTAAALLGARLDRQLVAAILLGQLDLPPLPEYPNLQTDLVARVSPDRLGEAIEDSYGDFRDDRVEAAFLVSPAIGPLLTEQSLAAIDRPLAVRWGDADDIAPPAQNALRYAAVPGPMRDRLATRSVTTSSWQATPRARRYAAWLPPMPFRSSARTSSGGPRGRAS